jgi:hypothetical protein
VEDSGKLGEVVFWMRSGAAGKFIWDLLVLKFW